MVRVPTNHPEVLATNLHGSCPHEPSRGVLATNLPHSLIQNFLPNSMVRVLTNHPEVKLTEPSRRLTSVLATNLPHSLIQNFLPNSMVRVLTNHHEG